MKPLGPVLFLFSAVAALSQQPQPLSQVRQFLVLTDDQVNTIIKNNNDYNSFSIQQQRLIQRAQAQITVETARDILDPLAIGTLYAGIESACRELRDRATASQKQNISLLSDAQKAKLNMLSDAMKLASTISEAQSGNLLGSAGSPPFFFNTFSSYITPGFSTSGVSGCSSSLFPGNIIAVRNPFAP